MVIGIETSALFGLDQAQDTQIFINNGEALDIHIMFFFRNFHCSFSRPNSNREYFGNYKSSQQSPSGPIPGYASACGRVFNN